MVSSLPGTGLPGATPPASSSSRGLGGENSTWTTAVAISASGTVTRCGLALPPSTSAMASPASLPTRASKVALPPGSGGSAPGRSVTRTFRPWARRQCRSVLSGRSMPGVETSSRYGDSPKSPAVVELGREFVAEFGDGVEVGGVVAVHDHPNPSLGIGMPSGRRDLDALEIESPAFDGASNELAHPFLGRHGHVGRLLVQLWRERKFLYRRSSVTRPESVKDDRLQASSPARGIAAGARSAGRDDGDGPGAVRARSTPARLAR